MSDNKLIACSVLGMCKRLSPVKALNRAALFGDVWSSASFSGKTVFIDKIAKGVMAFYLFYGITLMGYEKKSYKPLKILTCVRRFTRWNFLIRDCKYGERAIFDRFARNDYRITARDRSLLVFRSVFFIANNVGRNLDTVDRYFSRMAEKIMEFALPVIFSVTVAYLLGAQLTSLTIVTHIISYLALPGITFAVNNSATKGTMGKAGALLRQSGCTSTIAHALDFAVTLLLSRKYCDAAKSFCNVSCALIGKVHILNKIGVKKDGRFESALLAAFTALSLMFSFKIICKGGYKFLRNYRGSLAHNPGLNICLVQDPISMLSN